MNMYTCPHCYDEVPHGASVCRGCQAEISYGGPRYLSIVIFIVAALSGAKVLEFTSPTVAFTAMVIIFAVGAALTHKLFKNRVRFKRRYNT